MSNPVIGVQLGPMMLGKEEFERQQAVKVMAADVLGPMIVGPEDQQRMMAAFEASQNAPKVVSVPDADKQLSVKEVGSLLKDNPHLVDDIVRREAARPALQLDMRVSVLEAAKRAAMGLEGKEALVTAIDAALEQQRKALASE